MKLESIVLSSFRSYREAVQIDFSDGLTAIAGANGSGKSSVFDALMWALYGVGRGRIDEMVHTGNDNMNVQVWFTHNGDRFHVSRSVRFRDSGSVPSMVFERIGEVDVDDCEDLSENNIKDTHAAVAKIIGPPSVAYATWYLAQGQAGAFFTAQPADRRAILGDALGISGDWDRYMQLALDKRRHLDVVVQSAQGQVDRAQGALDSLPQLSEDALIAKEDELARIEMDQQQTSDEVDALEADLRDRRSEINDLYTELAQAKEKNHTIATWDARTVELHNQVSTLQSELAELEKLNADEKIAAAEKAKAEYEKKVQQFRPRLKVWQDRLGFLDRQVADASVIVKRAETKAGYYEQLEKLAPKDGKCPTCGQAIEDEASKAHVGAQVAALNEKIKALDAKERTPSVKVAEVKLRTAKEERSQLPEAPQLSAGPDTSEADRLKARKTLAEDRLERVEADVQRHKEAKPEGEKVDIMPLLRRQTELDDAIGGLTDDIALLNKTGIEQQGKAERLRLDIQTHNDDERSRKLFTEQLDEEREILRDSESERHQLDMLHQGLSPAGARQLILDTAIPQIEHAANLLLERISPGTVIDFQTQRESGVETLEIRVVDAVGYRRVENLSGGERTRVMFAVRVAMSQVAAQAHGLSALPAFIIDETFGDQDESGRTALLDALTTLATQVEQVIAITHDVELLGRIDQVVRLEKRDGATKVVV